MAKDIVLSSSQRSILLANQRVKTTIDGVQEALATGKDVNRPIDNPQNFFTSVSLSTRSDDLERRIDGIGQALRRVELADAGIEAIVELLDLAEATVAEFAINPDLEYPNLLPASVNDFSSYGLGGQDVGGIFELQNDGNDLLLDGNLWKYFELDYTVTENTILEFEYRSTVMPELASIAFDNDVNWNNSPRHFRIYGNQHIPPAQLAAPPSQFEYSGSGEFETFQIRVGDFYTGIFDRVALINDDDGVAPGPAIDGNSTWRNIRIYEEGSDPASLVRNAERQQLQDNYDKILEQIDQITEEANYRGVNLLANEEFSVLFNEDGSSNLVTQGTGATSAGLGLPKIEFKLLDDLALIQDKLREAKKSLRVYRNYIQSDLAILKTRLDFTDRTVNTLDAGAEELVVADQNKNSSELLALQTRQSLGTTALSLASDAFQSILRLF